VACRSRLIEKREAAAPAASSEVVEVTAKQAGVGFLAALGMTAFEIKRTPSNLSRRRFHSTLT
jgi:hypothetical protein